MVGQKFKTMRITCWHCYCYGKTMSWLCVYTLCINKFEINYVTVEFYNFNVYPIISQTSTATKWLVLYHLYPLLLLVPTFTFLWVYLGIPKQCGDEALTQLPERCHRLQCTCGSCSLQHTGIFNFEAQSNKTKRKIKKIFRDIKIVKSRSCVSEKKRKVYPPFPLRGLSQSWDCVFGFLERHWKTGTQVTPQMLVRPNLTCIVDKSWQIWV